MVNALPDEIFISNTSEEIVKNKISNFLFPLVINKNKLQLFSTQLYTYLREKKSEYLITELKKMLKLI